MWYVDSARHVRVLFSASKRSLSSENEPTNRSRRIREMTFLNANPRQRDLDGTIGGTSES